MYADIRPNIICQNVFAIFEHYVQKLDEKSEFNFFPRTDSQNASTDERIMSIDDDGTVIGGRDDIG